MPDRDGSLRQTQKLILEIAADLEANLGADAVTPDLVAAHLGKKTTHIRAAVHRLAEIGEWNWRIFHIGDPVRAVEKALKFHATWREGLPKIGIISRLTGFSQKEVIKAIKILKIKKCPFVQWLHIIEHDEYTELAHVPPTSMVEEPVKIGSAKGATDEFLETWRNEEKRRRKEERKNVKTGLRRQEA
jgi:hypothetical protein